MATRYAQNGLSQQELDDIYEELEEEVNNALLNAAVKQLQTWRTR